jgi:hypothetical protein
MTKTSRSEAATRFLLVAIDADLDRERRDAIFSAVKRISGVAMVADLSIISQETLDAILLEPARKVRAPRRGGRVQGTSGG